MLTWLASLRSEDRKEKRDESGEGRIVIGVQHIPVFHDGGFPDPKPYWVVSEPYRSQEMKILRQLGIKHMLVGHWHNGRVFEREGITWHVAPATSWLPWGGELGFAMHTISANGEFTRSLWRCQERRAKNPQTKPQLFQPETSASDTSGTSHVA